MEALVAVGLASNVAQFADFAARVVSAARKLYKSTTGVLSTTKELETLARHLRELAETENLRELAENTYYGNIRGFNRNPENEIWAQLNEQCMDIADELIKLLETFKVKGENRSAEVLYRAFRATWKQEDIDSLQKRLERISDYLNNRIRDRQQLQISRQLESLAIENVRLEAARTKEIQQLKEDFTQSFRVIKEELEKEGEITRAWLRLPVFAERGKELYFEQFFLNSLRFNTMDYRHTAILNQHNNTFRWIFDEQSSVGDSRPTVNFVQWLHQGYGSFWITGKPGSGKSTLMKFIAAHEHTEKYLKTWAGSRKLVIASFYFWSAAKDPLQKSQIGLLRSILYQILRQCPEFIQVAFPNSRSVFEAELQPDFGIDLIPELLAGFKRIVRAMQSSNVNFCFFVDGLDEYDGRPIDIIDLVEVLRQSPCIKICLSSRPWNEFDLKFGKGNPWKLYVQDLTKSDIRAYVMDTLGNNSTFQELREADSRCPDLVERIVQNADGVFLWVFLVVRSLLEGLTNADRIVDLERRLEEIPMDLEAYFERILNTVDVRYRQLMAHTFIITLGAYQNLPQICYWFIDENDDPDYAFNMPIELSKSKAIEAKINQVQKRLNARCKGLLQTGYPYHADSSVHPFEWRVDFLHRTVRDFFAIASMEKLIRSWSSDVYDLDRQICNSIIAIIKTAPPAIPSTQVTPLLPTFFYHARRLADRTTPEFQIQLVEGLKHSVRDRGIENEVFSWNCGLSRNAASRWSTRIGLLLNCIRGDLKDYVSLELERRPTLLREEGPLLLATCFVQIGQALEPGCESVHVLQLLLQNGVDPNMPLSKYDNDKQQTPWEFYLTKLKEAQQNKVIGPHVDITASYESIKLLLIHGANLDFRLGNGLTESTVIASFQGLFKPQQFEMLLCVIKSQQDKGKSNTKGQRRVEFTAREPMPVAPVQSLEGPHLFEIHTATKLLYSNKQQRNNMRSHVGPQLIQSEERKGRRGICAILRGLKGRRRSKETT